MAIRYKSPYLLIAMVLAWQPLLSANELIDELSQEYEIFLLSKLAQAQKPPARLVAFSSDGCSGGLSEGWQLFAKLAPAFHRKYGEKPPWEHCCVEHDRAYWQGEADSGFDKRKSADLALKQCVIETGRRMKPDLLDKQGLTEDQFSLAASLVYRAVRVGGLPCSIFPWRWGYGWPSCFSLNNNWPGVGSEVK